MQKRITPKKIAKAKKARTKAVTWAEVFEALDAAAFPDDFLSEKERDRSLPRDFDLLGDDDGN